MKSPPSEVYVHETGNGNTPNKHSTRPPKDHHNIQMNDVIDRDSNGSAMINGNAGNHNGGYDESDLSGAHVDVEFDQAFDYHVDEQNDGRLTRRSGGSNNSTIIKVADENKDTEPSRKNPYVDDRINPLNQTATSVKHVQLSEQNVSASSSELTGNQNANWNDNAECFGNQNQPPNVDSS